MTLNSAWDISANALLALRLSLAAALGLPCRDAVCQPLCRVARPGRSPRCSLSRSRVGQRPAGQAAAHAAGGPSSTWRRGADPGFAASLAETAGSGLMRPLRRVAELQEGRECESLSAN